ncbi:MAG: DinB family protein [Flavobacteriales bacterium]|nr:DinB family protein [Flavobacteriales bacterium]
MIIKPIDLHPKAFYTKFIDVAPKKDLIDSLHESQETTISLFGSIKEENGSFQYEEGKWTIKQVIRHLSDVERAFIYGAFRYSRKDTTELTGFNHLEYPNNDNSENVTLENLIQEFSAIRNSSIHLFKTMNLDNLDFEGKGNGVILTARIVGWLASGHSTHHSNTVREKYLPLL